MEDRFKFSNLSEFMDAFPSEKYCIEYLEKKRWPNGVIISPFDPTAKVYRRKDGTYRCSKTKNNFNVKQGTIFQGAAIPLRKWFLAIYLLTSRKRGISATQLAKDLGISEPCAWLMLHKIRGAMAYNGEKLDGEVEIDETFVGGKNKNRHKDKQLPMSRGRALYDKIAVMGMKQRDGNVICEVTVDTRTKSLTKPILEHVDKDAKIYVDEWKGYNQVKKTYKNGVVNHSKQVWADGDACTNQIEGFWGTYCKRSLIGCYNNVSGAHMHRYFNEFTFRHNTRNVSDYERFELFFDNIEHPTTEKEIKSEFKERNRRNLSKISEEQWAFWRAREKKRKQKEKESKKKRQARNKRYYAKKKAQQAALQAIAASA